MNAKTARRLERNIERIENDILLRERIEEVLIEAEKEADSPFRGRDEICQWKFYAQQLRQLLK